MTEFSRQLSDHYLRDLELAEETVGSKRADEIAEAHADVSWRWFGRE